MKVSEDVERLLARPRGDSQVYKDMGRDRLMAAYKLRNIHYWGKEPLLHQRASTLACLSRDNYLLLLDKGLGKSKVILDVFSHRHFQHGGKIRGLLLCPNQTAVQGWQDQIKEHAPWAKFKVCPSDPAAKREFYRHLDQECQLVVMDYPSLQTILCDLDDGKWRLSIQRAEELGQQFAFVALDEIHLLKDASSLRFQTVMALINHSSYVYGATATLFNQDPVEAWAQCYLVDTGETFGQTISAFRHLFCKDQRDRFAYRGFISVFDESKMGLFRQWLRGISIRYLFTECIKDMPSLRMVEPELAMTDEQRRFYRLVLKEVKEAKKADPEAKVNSWQKLRRVMSGFIPMGELECVPMAVSPKLEWLKARIQQWNEPVVIFYEFTTTGRQLVQELNVGRAVGWLHGEQKDKKLILRNWNSGWIDVLVIQSQVGAAALNLQRARRQVFFECPSSAIVRSQAEARCWRMGQEKVTYIYDLFFPNTVEQKVLERVHQGMGLHSAVTDGVEEESEL